MQDWLYIVGGVIVLIWIGAWLLVRLGNFDAHIAQVRNQLELRMHGIEQQMQNTMRGIEANKREAQEASARIDELKTQIDKLRQQADEQKKTIALLEGVVGDLRIKAQQGSHIRFG